MKDSAQQLDDARRAKEKAKGLFRGYPVNGIGLTRQEEGYAVKVNLETEPSDWSELPVEIEGVPIVVRVVGTIRKQGG